MPDQQAKELNETDAAVDDEVDSDESGTGTSEDPNSETAPPAESDVAASNSESAAPEPEPTPSVRARLATSGRTALRATRRALPALALILLVVLAATTGVLGWKYQRQRDIDAAGAAALRAATDYAVTLTSVDTGNLDANFTAVLAGSTGEFRDVYTKSSSQLRQLLIDHKATGHGVVLQAAVKSASEHEVVVLLFVDQTVSNTEMPDPRIDHSRIVMTMQNVDGQWKAAKVDIP
ncbi:hypothetical protein [Nocardia inohanensis]|uniref:hypothetical protein n=1 Tax=Nocardia inohanensis TaxID=209246 RepID=UPI00082ED158|nr:hypothetical protein [Nocardia inohanensis]